MTKRVGPTSLSAMPHSGGLPCRACQHRRGKQGNRAPPAEQLASQTSCSYPTGKGQPTLTGEAEQPRTVSGTAMQDVFFSFFFGACVLGQPSPTGEAERPRTAGGTAQQAGHWHS